MTKFAEMAGFENVIQPPHEIHNNKAHPLKGKWNETLFGNNRPIVLELGCGKGEYTVALAEKSSEKNHIGIDIKGARIFTGAKYALRNNIKNAVFLRTHIENIDCFFDENEVSEIWVTFPDPQMKKVRKRLTSSWFMEKYSRLLKPDGIIHLKTDSGFLYEYTSELVKINNLEIIAKTEDLYNSDLRNDILNVKTFYEKQWSDRGIAIKYIAFILSKKGNWLEPEGKFEKDAYRSFGRSARELRHE
ncbi:MAG: tRNA (guanosine(46)-N7)-methyltransferase TrmB [Prolixibacteraceae bacterium]|nr:tRNA (guanosine(46)-N7)-methyltransferase TrmB [Prolixibacteraceae bacterium]